MAIEAELMRVAEDVALGRIFRRLLEDPETGTGVGETLTHLTELVVEGTVVLDAIDLSVIAGVLRITLDNVEPLS